MLPDKDRSKQLAGVSWGQWRSHSKQDAVQILQSAPTKVAEVRIRGTESSAGMGGQ